MGRNLWYRYRYMLGNMNKYPPYQKLQYKLTSFKKSSENSHCLKKGSNTFKTKLEFFFIFYNELDFLEPVIGIFLICKTS